MVSGMEPPVPLVMVMSTLVVSAAQEQKLTTFWKSQITQGNQAQVHLATLGQVATPVHTVQLVEAM